MRSSLSLRVGVRSHGLLQTSDEELLSLIAKGDNEAFNQLYARYAGVAYRLACHITGKNDLAQDAVQEAFLTIWKKAKNYDSRLGAPRPWILSIISKKSLHSPRKCRHPLEREMSSADAPVAFSGGPEERACAQELSRELRCCMEGFLPLERALLSLYFGAGLSQQAIARHLSIPQRTISARLQALIGTLRSRLVQMKLFLDAPQSLQEGLRALLSKSEPEPPGLRQSIQERLSAEERPAPAAGRWSWPGRAGAGVISVLLAGALVWALGRSGVPSVDEGPVPLAPSGTSPLPALASAQPASAWDAGPVPLRRPFFRFWDFNTAEKVRNLRELQLSGNCRWDGKDLIFGEGGVRLLHPLPPFEGALRIAARFEFLGGTCGTSVALADARGVLPYRSKGAALPGAVRKERHFYQAYLRGPYVYLYYGGAFCCLAEYASLATASQVCLIGQQYGLQEYMVSEVGQGAFPKELREDPARLFQRLKWRLQEVGASPFPAAYRSPE